MDEPGYFLGQPFGDFGNDGAAEAVADQDDLFLLRCDNRSDAVRERFQRGFGGRSGLDAVAPPCPSHHKCERPPPARRARRASPTSVPSAPCSNAMTHIG